MAFTGLCNRFRHLNTFIHIKQSKWYLKNSNYSCTQFGKTLSTYSLEVEHEKEAFKSVLPDVINSLQNDPKFFEMPEAADWMKKMLEYTMIGGKNIRGLTTVMTYKTLQDEDKLTEEYLNLSRKLGWCVEMAYCVIVDDIMDKSLTRRGAPCWYRRPDVGLACAVNDSVMINSALFQVLRTYFAHLPNYIDMFHLVNETIVHTANGQHLDYKTAHNNKDYSNFTIDRYFTIVKYKSAYYTFYLPITLGMLLVGSIDQKIFHNILPICLKIGKLFQIQDDFIDCFGNEDLTGKTGTDIQEGKCSWLAVNALLRCSDAQRVVFKACYGSTEPAHIDRIKRLYEELQLPDVYKNQERLLYTDTMDRINAVPCEITQQLFKKILDIQYQREQ